MSSKLSYEDLSVEIVTLNPSRSTEVSAFALIGAVKHKLAVDKSETSNLTAFLIFFPFKKYLQFNAAIYIITLLAKIVNEILHISVKNLSQIYHLFSYAS